MKMFYGNTPIKSLNIRHFEMDTNDCDMVASDLQAGKTAVARGRKITGTGKSFEFASYGYSETNLPTPIPTSINIIEVACLYYPVQLSVALNNMKDVDFSQSQVVGEVTIDGTAYPISVQVVNNVLTISCERDIMIQVFYGKDNYV